MEKTMDEKVNRHVGVFAFAMEDGKVRINRVIDKEMSVESAIALQKALPKIRQELNHISAWLEGFVTVNMTPPVPPSCEKEVKKKWH